MGEIKILTTLLTSKDAEDYALRSYYHDWRKINRQSKEPFFALYERFKEHLKTLEHGPLRLYLYFGMHSNNDYGYSWHSIQTIADFFEVQTRTIDNWIRQLTDAGLIYRVRKGKRSHTTYLLPYTNTLIQHYPQKRYTSDDELLVNDFISTLEAQPQVFGRVICAFHLFQWGRRRKSKSVSIDSSLQWLLIITERKDGVLIGHYQILKNLTDQGISEKTVENVATFKSPLLYKKQPLIGIAISHEKRLYEDFKRTIKMVEQLAIATSLDLENHPQVQYGSIDAVLDAEEEVINDDEPNQEE